MSQDAHPFVLRHSESLHNVRQDGTKTRYYQFPEYELHHNELPPGVVQEWHHHEKIEEAVYIISGSVMLLWLDETGEHRLDLKTGDLARLGRDPHTLSNETGEPAEFLVLKMVPIGSDNTSIFATDRWPDPVPPVNT